jgi:hypothetical protein
VQTLCQAVDVSEFQLIAERVVDLSPRGMLVACGARTRVGNRVAVSFLVPGTEDLWFEAEAVVVRIVEGDDWPAQDGGYGAGLAFTFIEKRCRDELLSRLAGYPPRLPKRRWLEERAESGDSQSLSPLAIVQDTPVPSERRRLKVPQGAFAS